MNITEGTTEDRTDRKILQIFNNIVDLIFGVKKKNIVYTVQNRNTQTKLKALKHIL